MCSWSDLMSLPQSVYDQLRAFYGDHFPMEFRQYLDYWLVERLNQNISMNESDLHLESQSFFNDLLMQLQLTASNLTSDEYCTIKIRLHEAGRNIRQYYSNNPVQLYTHLRNCLKFEQQLLNNPDLYSNNECNEPAKITEKLERLIFNIREIDNENRNLKTEFENFYLQSNESNNNNYVDFFYDPMAIQNMEYSCTASVPVNDCNQMNQNNIKNGYHNLSIMTKSVISDVEMTQELVIEKYLQEFQLNQKRKANGAITQPIVSLDDLQSWFQKLANILLTLKEQIMLIMSYKDNYQISEVISTEPFPNMLQKVEKLLQKLMSKSLVIERQPPQVIMTNKKFTASVRCLIANALNINMPKIPISVKIISETQAQQVHQTNNCTEFCGELLNGNGFMEYNETSKKLSITFINIQLNTSKCEMMKERKRKSTHEKVVDKKFALLFHSTIHLGHAAYNIWTYSLPIVVTVHVSQEPHAWATILWDNAFSELTRTSFAVPEKVQWKQLGEALKMKFYSATDGFLTNENLHFLCEKILRCSIPMHSADNYEVTWTQFAKDNLPNCAFTFWEWFFEIMKLTRLHLKGPWRDGLIIGFVDRSVTEQYLFGSSGGTFLLRFSESELGGITIASIDHQYQITHLQPFTAKDLEVHSLADSIRDFDFITHLYGFGHKSEAFRNYMTPKQVEPRRKNYVSRGIRAMVVE